jgi:hypothetical protein
VSAGEIAAAVPFQCFARTLEPLRCGDRQRQKRVAKARNPLQSGAFEVSLS